MKHENDINGTVADNDVRQSKLLKRLIRLVCGEDMKVSKGVGLVPSPSQENHHRHVVVGNNISNDVPSQAIKRRKVSKKKYVIDDDSSSSDDDDADKPDNHGDDENDGVEVYKHIGKV